MILIPVKNDGGLVTIDVEIEGTPVWSYLYDEDQLHRNAASEKKPGHHTLGQPHELIDSNHDWEFRLANPTDNEITVQVSIEWKQSGAIIANWSEKVKIDGGSGELVFGNGLVSKT